MSHHDVRSYRYSAIKHQMQRVAGDHERHLRQAWVDRMLELLDGDNLIAQAAAGLATDGHLLLDCNIAPLVWDDPRIVYRRKQLENGNVSLELVDHESTIAGKTFKRTQIKVTFAG